MASFVWGFPPPIPTPAHPSVFCLLEAKSCTSASCWQTAGVPCSLPPASLALSSLSPFLLCFWFTPTSSWGLQVTAVPCLPLCSAVSGGVVSPPDSGILGISPPQPQGCAPALSGAAITVLQPYLAQPYLCSVRCHGDRSLCPSSSLWPCCPPGAWLRVNPVLGVPAVGGELPTGSIPWELHRQGSQSQEKIFWAFSRPILMPRMGGLQQ